MLVHQKVVSSFSFDCITSEKQIKTSFRLAWMCCIDNLYSYTSVLLYVQCLFALSPMESVFLQFEQKNKNM